MTIVGLVLSVRKEILRGSGTELIPPSFTFSLIVEAMSGVPGSVSVYLLEGYVRIILSFRTEAIRGLHALRYNTHLE